MKNNKDSKEVKVTKTGGVPMHGIWGIALLFVCASIGYANYVVFFGTEGLVPKLMLVPSSLFVTAFLVLKAAK